MAAERSHSYGGQAVIEGVMIRGERNYSVAVRRPDGTVATRSQSLGGVFTGRVRKFPFVRGVMVLAETLSIGMKALSYSAAVGSDEENEELGKGAVALMVSVSLLFAIILFFLIPVFASKGRAS